MNYTFRVRTNKKRNNGFHQRLACVLAACILCTAALAGVGATTVAAEHAAPETHPGRQSQEPGGLPGAPEAVPGSASAREAAYRSDTVLVSLPADADSKSVNAALEDVQSVETPAVSEADIAAGFAELTLAAGYDVPDAVQELSGIDAVSDPQPDYLYYLMDGENRQKGRLASACSLIAQATSINDPKAPDQWHLNGTAGINAYDAWDLARGESPDAPVSVAVIDSGCLTTHQDLADNIVASYDASGSGVTDINGHGTHVCGIVAATTNNEIGVSGVSYNAKIIPIQAFEYVGNVLSASTSTILKAYSFIMKNRATYNTRVVNMSLGAAQNSASTYDDRALITAIETAYNHGILTVCAAGNDAYEGAYNCYPCDFVEHGIGAIALTDQQERASFSNYNLPGQTTKDLAAPGSRILSTSRSSTAGYTTMSGTSMATPVIAGTAALVFTANGSLSAGEAIGILRESATDLKEAGFDDETGYGEVNAYEAVMLATETEGSYVEPEPEPDPEPEAEPEPDPEPEGDAESESYVPRERIPTIWQAIDLKSASIRLSSTSLTFNGKSRFPTATVTYWPFLLREGRDYTLAYKNNLKTGIATVTATGIGSFTGSASKTFTIKPAKVTEVKVTSTKAGTAKVTWSKSKAVAGKATGYLVRYKKGSRTKTYQVENPRTSKLTLTKLSKGKKVSVKVCAYKIVNGTRYCGSWSTTKSVRVKK